MSCSIEFYSSKQLQNQFIYFVCSLICVKRPQHNSLCTDIVFTLNHKPLTTDPVWKESKFIQSISTNKIQYYLRFLSSTRIRYKKINFRRYRKHITALKCVYLCGTDCVPIYFSSKTSRPTSSLPPSSGPLSDSCHTHVICALEGICTRAGAKTYYFIYVREPTIKIIYAFYVWKSGPLSHVGRRFSCLINKRRIQVKFWDF